MLTSGQSKSICTTTNLICHRMIPRFAGVLSAKKTKYTLREVTEAWLKYISPIPFDSETGNSCSRDSSDARWEKDWLIPFKAVRRSGHSYAWTTL